MSLYNNFLVRYYKRYKSFWCRVSSISIVVLVLIIGYHHKLDSKGTFLLGFLIPLGAATYKAHDDKDKKNEPIFKGRRECFHDLRDIVYRLYGLSSRDENFYKIKRNLEKELTELYIKVQQYFGCKSPVFYFIDEVRKAAIYFLGDIEERSSKDRQRQYAAAGEYLRPFLKEKEFLNRCTEFELDMFKPKTFDPIWEKPFEIC